MNKFNEEKEAAWSNIEKLVNETFGSKEQRDKMVGILLGLKNESDPEMKKLIRKLFREVGEFFTQWGAANLGNVDSEKTEEKDEKEKSEKKESKVKVAKYESVFAEKKAVKLSGTNMKITNFGKDRNGNTTITIEFDSGKKKTIQTNQNLPETHRIIQSGSKVLDLSDKELDTVAAELVEYFDE